MATKRRIPLNKIEGVGAGSTAIIELPKNVRYHAIVLQYGTNTAGGATEANMELEVKDIRVEINETTQRTATAKQLFDINRTKGVEVKDGFLPIFFSEPQRNTQLERELTAWGMNGVDDFQIRIDIADNGQVPTISGFAIVDDVVEAPRGIVKWKRNKITNASTGELPYSLPTIKGDSYQGLFLFETAAGDIDNLLIEWDGVKIHQLTEDQQDAYIEFIANNTIIVPAMQHVSFDNNIPADSLRTVKLGANGVVADVEELIMTLTMAAGNPVTVIREMVGLPD